MRIPLASLALILLSCCIEARATDDIVIADFEGDTYGDWTTTGSAFGKGPAHGALPGQMPVSGFLGKGLVNSYFGGDGATGTLSSPVFTVSRDYITFLIGGGSHEKGTFMELLVDDKPVSTATGRDDEQLDWTTWDVRPFKGKSATIRIVDNETGGWGHINVDQIMQSDKPQVMPEKPAPPSPLYAEIYRPQFHFTAARDWLNDPNGLVFFKGEYHLFFQRTPQSLESGDKSWGHAISTDLVHWEQLADALSPDRYGDIWSGSAVVDRDNTAGFQNGDEPALVAMYTAAGGHSAESKGEAFTQRLAYSTDRGRTWKMYEKNPVIAHIVGGNRDPRMVWYSPGKKWILALYLDKNTYALFSSPDLKSWTKLQDLNVPGCGECPDFFPMPVDGSKDNIKWVFTAANGRYLVGAFDGTRFTPEEELRQVDYGKNYYAVQSYSDVPESDGRRIQIAWMAGGRYPHMRFNQQMSFPAEMQLKTTADGLRIFRNPVAELSAIRGEPHRWADLSLKPGDNPLSGFDGETFELRAELEPGDASEIGFVVRGEPISYSVPDKKLTSLGTAPLELEHGRLTLHILVDRTSIETFGNNGRVSLTSCFLPKASIHKVEVYAKGGTARIVKLEVNELKSAWGTIQPGSPK